MLFISLLLLLFQNFSGVKTECPPNNFKLAEMENCHPFLTCEDEDDITLVRRIGEGAVKDVFLINWKGIPLVLSVPINQKFVDDFLSGVEVLRLLNPSKQITQYLGYCDRKHALFTEYHLMGNAADYFSKRKNITSLQSLEFCHQFSLILNHLHNGPAGKRVFCDSNSLYKLLTQLLVTSDLKLILNDVDALPEVVNSSGIKCGHRQLTGAFVAPEQLWIHNGDFDDELMPGYDEKTDIWKAASVCDFFVNQAINAEVVKYRLFDLHSRCRNYKPSSRPTAGVLVQEYVKVLKEFKSHSEL